MNEPDSAFVALNRTTFGATQEVLTLRTSLADVVPIATCLGALTALLASATPAAALDVEDEARSLLASVETRDAEFSLSPALASAPREGAVLSLASYPRAGWQAVLSTNAHGVRGTVVIVDADTFRVDNFFYDGGGINVHFILAAANDNTTFRNARLVTDPNLLGMAHSGDSITIDLPAGTTFDGYNAISLWCIPAQANFGSGTFVNTVPEPTSATLLALGALGLGSSWRRRPRQGR